MKQDPKQDPKREAPELLRPMTSSEFKSGIIGVFLFCVVCVAVALVVLWILFAIEARWGERDDEGSRMEQVESPFIEVGPRKVRPAPTPQPPDHHRVR